ncbi:MAG TPA: tetratricopeptide repeat protein [Candidatus Xenobia bacterium]|jgi:hypothetical protein
MVGHRTWQATWLLLVVAAAIRLSFQPLNAMDTDTWWHLAGGRVFATQLTLPHQDPFSYTSDVPWLPYEWLYDTGIYCLMVAHGMTGLLVMRAVVVALVGVGMYLLLIQLVGRTAMAGAGALFALVLLEPYYLIRPHVVGYLAFLAFLHVLYRMIEGAGRPIKPLHFVLAVALLVFITVNFHVTFIFMIGFLAVWLASDAGAASLRWIPAPHPQRGWGLAALAVSMLASLCNPRGWHMALHPFDYLAGNIYTRSIAEYMPVPLSQQPVVNLVLIGLSLVSVGLAWRQRRPWLLAILLLLTFEGQKSSRYFAYQVLFTLPALACLTRSRWELIEHRGKLIVRLGGLPRMNVAGLTMVLLMAAGFLGWQTARWDVPVMRTVDWDTFPIDAVRFIDAGRLPRRIFNAFEWGGYLEWELPDHQVFMDARNDVAYSGNVYVRFLKVVEATPQWRSILDQYRVDVALLRLNDPVLPINAAMAQAPDWEEVYRDHNAVIYMRRAALTPAARRRLPLGYAFPHSPYLDVFLGQQALAKRQPQEAMSEFSQAVQGDPWYAPAYVGLGVVTAQQGARDEARGLFERAIAIDPRAFMAHYNLGIYWEMTGDRRQAAQEYRAELAIHPTFQPARQGLQRVSH